jgi:hypothetical protein
MSKKKRSKSNNPVKPRKESTSKFSLKQKIWAVILSALTTVIGIIGYFGTHYFDVLTKYNAHVNNEFETLKL